jgi:hypothetical protein
MDINQLLEQAKQRGLEAINLLRPKPSQPTQIQQPSVTQTPRPTTFEVFKPQVLTPVFKSVISTPIQTPVSSVPSIKPLISTNLPVQQPKPQTSFELPKPSEILFGDVAKQINRNFEYNWNKLVSETVNMAKTQIAPLAKNYIEATKGGQVDLATILLEPSPEKRKELTTKLGEQQKAGAQLEAQLALGALQAVNIPSETFNRSVIQPTYQNNLLNEREKILGIPATQEERNAANLGDLNKSTNTLLNRSLATISPAMTPQEKIKLEENNWNYWLAEVRDTAVSLIDYETLTGLGAIGTAGVQKLTAKTVAETAQKAAEKTIKYTPEDLLTAVAKGDKKEIETIIKRPLTAAEDTQIDFINEIPKSDIFNKELKDLRQQTFFGRIGEGVSDTTKKFNELWENRKVEKIAQENLTEYDRTVRNIREQAAGVRTLKEKLGDGWLDLRRAYWNKRAFSFETLDRIAKESGNLSRKDNPKYFVDAIEKTSERAETFLNTAGFYRALTTAVREAKDILKRSEDVVDNFGNFLEARRRLTLSDLGIQKLDDNAYATYKAIFDERKERYVEATKQFDEFINKLVLKAQEAGILTPEQVKAFLETGDYAPFHRIFNEFTSGPRTSLTKSKQDLARQTVFQKIGFNDGVIKNPLEAAELMTYSVLNQADRNIYASKWGNLIRNGYVKGAYIVRDAKNVIRQAQIKDTLEEVNKAREKLTKTLNRTKDAVRKSVKELNQLNRKGINLALKPNTPEQNSRFTTRITNVINKNIAKRDELIKESEDLFQNILKLKQDGETVLNDTKFINRTNRMLDTREEWVSDLVDIGAINLSKKGKKYMKDFKGEFPNLKFRKEYIRQLPREDILDFIYEFYDLPENQLNKLIKKATTNKLKIETVLKEIDDIKKAQVTNTLVNSLVSLPDKDLANMVNKLGKKQTALGEVVREIKKASDDRFYNSLVNSLIDKTPEELNRIKNKITKKDEVLNSLIDDLLKQQETLDIKTGYAKSLKEESELLDELDRNGQPYISWLNNGVQEIAVVDKRLAEEFFKPNTGLEEDVLKRAVNFFVINPTKYWKAGTTTFIPDSRIRQFVKDAETIGFFFDGEVRNSILNPINFVEAVKDVTRQTPEYARFVELGGGGSFYKSLGDSQGLQQFARQVNKKINYTNLKDTRRINTFDALAGADEVARRFQIFKAVRDDLVKKGMDPYEAELEAVWQSNNVLPNYFQTGTASDVLELALIYSKIKMQSAKVILRNFKENPLGTSARIVGKIAIPTTIVTTWNMSDGDRAKVYEDVPEDIKKRNIIIVPPFPINPDGTYKTVYKIPVEETLMSFSNPFRRSVEAAFREGNESDFVSFSREFFSPKSGAGVLEATTGISIPTDYKTGVKDIGSSINPIFRGPIELASNYEFFRERNIVTDEVKDRSAINQWDDKTSILAKELSLKTGMSPMVIDWFIRTYAQGISKYSQRPLEEAIKLAKNDPELTTTSKDPIKELQNSLTFQSEVKPGTKDVTESYEILNKKKQEDADRNFVVKNAMAEGDIDKLKALAPSLTEAQFNQLYTSMQKQAAQTSLTNTQKVLFNSSETEINKIVKEKPELAADAALVTQYKKEVSDLPKLDTTGFNFLPSKSKGGGGGGVKVSKGKLPTFKSGGGTGRVRIPKPKMATLKAPKALKIKRIKQPKLAKVKPLKKVKRF